MRKPLLALAGATAVVALQAAPAAAQDQYNCDDFQYQEEAQAVYDEDPSDPHGLDGPVGDESSGTPGIACESLPSRGGGGGGGEDDGDDSAAGGIDQLPRTGPEDQLALAGGLLVAGGVTLVVVSRRRRSEA